MNELNENVKKVNAFLATQTDHSKRERLLMQVMKITEEVGEMNEAIIQEVGGQMRSKASKNLDTGSEIADVIICTLLVADLLGVDTWEEVDKKMEKVLARMQ